MINCCTEQWRERKRRKKDYFCWAGGFRNFQSEDKSPVLTKPECSQEHSVFSCFCVLMFRECSGLFCSVLKKILVSIPDVAAVEFDRSLQPLPSTL